MAATMAGRAARRTAMRGHAAGVGKSFATWARRRPTAVGQSNSPANPFIYSRSVRSCLRRSLVVAACKQHACTGTGHPRREVD